MPTNIDQVTGGVEALLFIKGSDAGAFVPGLNGLASTKGEGATVTRSNVGIYVLQFTPAASPGNPAGGGVPEADCIINVTVKGAAGQLVTVTDTNDFQKTIQTFAVDGTTHADADIDVEVKRVVHNS